MTRQEFGQSRRGRTSAKVEAGESHVRFIGPLLRLEREPRFLQCLTQMQLDLHERFAAAHARPNDPRVIWAAEGTQPTQPYLERTAVANGLVHRLDDPRHELEIALAKKTQGQVKVLFVHRPNRRPHRCQLIQHFTKGSLRIDRHGDEQACCGHQSIILTATIFPCELRRSPCLNRHRSPIDTSPHFPEGTPVGGKHRHANYAVNYFLSPDNPKGTKRIDNMSSPSASAQCILSAFEGTGDGCGVTVRRFEFRATPGSSRLNLP